MIKQKEEDVCELYTIVESISKEVIRRGKWEGGSKFYLQKVLERVFIHVIIIFGPNSWKFVITCQNLNFIIKQSSNFDLDTSYIDGFLPLRS